MRSSGGGKLLRLTGAIAVILLSFWVTLEILDYLNPASQGIVLQPPKTLYALSRVASDWIVVDPSVTRLSLTPDGISLQSSAPAQTYQWTTRPIFVKADANYVVSYHVNVDIGKMGIGVLNYKNSAWIKTDDIVNQPSTMAFKASSNQIEVILYGTTPPPTAATIFSIAIAESPVQ